VEAKSYSFTDFYQKPTFHFLCNKYSICCIYIVLGLMNLCLNQNKHNMKKIIYTLAFIFSLTGSAIAQWTDLKAPQVPSNGLPGQNSGHDYGLLAISKDGKNIAAYSSKTVWSPGYANTKHFIVSKDFGATWTENAGPSMNPIQFFWKAMSCF
jgi:hypothetical protein